ncbi:hypothetical protein D3C87_2147970 [compost metagenome]
MKKRTDKGILHDIFSQIRIMSYRGSPTKRLCSVSAHQFAERFPVTRASAFH